MFSIMKQKIVVSNVRFPYEDWMIVKSGAAHMGMSINEYFQYLSRYEVIRSITGAPKKISKNKYSGLDALLKFAHRKHKGKPMGANEDDKIIYDVE